MYCIVLYAILIIFHVCKLQKKVDFIIFFLARFNFFLKQFLDQCFNFNI